MPSSGSCRVSGADNDGVILAFTMVRYPQARRPTARSITRHVFPASYFFAPFFDMRADVVSHVGLLPSLRGDVVSHVDLLLSRIPGTPYLFRRDAPPASTGGSDQWGTHSLLSIFRPGPAGVSGNPGETGATGEHQDECDSRDSPVLARRALGLRSGGPAGSYTSEDWGVVFLVSARDTRAAHEHVHPCDIPRPAGVPGSRTEKRGLK